MIPAGTQTLAKGPSQYVDGVAPKYLARGKGARVWDVDGNEFIDLTMAVGPLVLGYGHPSVDRVNFPADPNHPDADNIRRLFAPNLFGGMVSFDFGPGAAGGRIMVLFERRRVALCKVLLQKPN